MGAQASRDASAATDVESDQQSEELAARAWRTGVPFTLFHDEGFVTEKYQELLASSSVKKADKTSSKVLEEAQTTASGLDEAPMDEMRHATDIARVKLFSRKRREDGSANGARLVSPPSPAKPTQASAGNENPPSALAGMVGNMLSRESPESVNNEKMRAQRDELLQVYYEQMYARTNHKKMQAVEDILNVGTAESDLASNLVSSVAEREISSVTMPFSDERHTISQGVSPASVFSVGSLRMQLEMLREFRVLSPRLFEKGVMALVQTMLDSPPFVLCDVSANSPEDVHLADVHKFCQELLRGDCALSAVQWQVLLLLLLALGVSSGRISLLLEFVDELLRSPHENLDRILSDASTSQELHFANWVEVFIQRMQTYRIEFTLGTFEENSFIKKFSVKALPGDVIATNKDDATQIEKSASSCLATDGSFVYSWSLTNGLVKMGTGLNFTIAGRVYAEVPAKSLLDKVTEKRSLRKMVYGFGEEVLDVSEIARQRVVWRGGSLPSDALAKTVHDVFCRNYGSGASRLLVSYYVGNSYDIVVLDDQDEFILPVPCTEGTSDKISARVCRAWYGDMEILNDAALLELQEQLGKKQANHEIEDGVVGVTYTRELLEQLLTLSDISLEVISVDKRMMVIYDIDGALDSLGAQFLLEGDQFVDIEDRDHDAYFSSLVFCGDSLYLNVTYPERDASNMLTDVSFQRCRTLLRISPQHLSLLEILSLGKGIALSGKTPPPAARPCTMALCAYITEGKLIYEIDLGSKEFVVTVFTPKRIPGKGRHLEATRKFTLHLKSALCCEVVLCLTRIRNMSMGKDGRLEAQLPSFYTNGAFVAMLLKDSSATKHASPKYCVHCVLFDCESGQAKPVSNSDERGGCLERSLPLSSVCFDARNNFLWLYTDHKRELRSYQNTGKRISLDENVIPCLTAKDISANGHEEKHSFAEATGLSVLGFLYKNAIARMSADGHASVYPSGKCHERIPFSIDTDVTTFRLLLAFTAKYVDVFKTNEASAAQGYILQACLGVLNRNLEALLSLGDGPPKQSIIASLHTGLTIPLDKLLEFSITDDNQERMSPVMSGPAASFEIDEKIRVQVASVALDLYTTSIRVFHADVGKQFTHILKYLQLWQQAMATAMELKILARLLAHVCTRVDAIYQSMLDSDETLKQFLQLVEFAHGMHRRHIREALMSRQNGPKEISLTSAVFHGDDDTDKDSFELISLVNAITQAVFVAAAYSPDSRNPRVLEIALVVFTTIRDACDTICTDLAEQLIQHDCKTQWQQTEKVLKDGFMGVLAPVVVSSGVSFLRNRKYISSMVNMSGLHNATSDDNASGNVSTPPALLSQLPKFLQNNASRLSNFIKNLGFLESMIDPLKRENTMESVSMVMKVETMESSHEYENNMDTLTELQIPGAIRMVISFDPRCRTEVNYDYLTFYKDKSQGEFYGSQYYSGRDSEQNWPGVGDNPPLIIESDHCFVYFHSDGSNTDWGYKFTASAEILEKKKARQQHWIVFLLENVVQLLDESVKLLVDGSIFAPIEEVEVLNDRFLQSDLLKNGICAEDSKNAEVLQLLQDFVDPPEESDANKVINALLERSGVPQPGLALARSSSFEQITSSAPNKYVNSAVRAVAAAILHHNMWGMDAYAFSQNLRSDISEQLLHGWKNAQKMRDWFHLGDAADAGIHGQAVPNRRRSGRLRRQPSAYKGLSDESLAILCDNVIKRAKFLLEITPVSFAYVTGAKRRWGLLTKYGHAIGKQSSSDSQLDKWYNLLDELQAATELRSLFQYRRLSSERLKNSQNKSVTEQVLEFIQSDVDVAEVRKIIDTRNRRADSRALGMEIFIQALQDCPSVRLRGVLLDSFTSTLKCFALAHSPTSVASGVSPAANSMSTSDTTFPRMHFDALLLGCDEVLRQRLAEAFGNCLTLFSTLLNSDDSALITCVLKCCALDYDLEDSYLLQESQILPMILQQISSASVPIRNAAQSVLSVLLSRFIAGRAESSEEDHSEDAVNGAHDGSTFQGQLFAAVGHQLEDIVSSAKASMGRPKDGVSLPRYLPENSPGLTSPCLQNTAVGWNHSILLWVYTPSKGSLYALKLDDEVRRGPNWIGDTDNDEVEVGTVVGIPNPTQVLVRWSSGTTSQHEFDPKKGIFEIVLVDEGVGGMIFFKGNKNLIKDSSAAKPWSYLGLSLSDKRMLVYKIACGSDKETVFETDCELDADEWSHIAIVQNEDTLKIYVNGSMVSQHLLESFLVLNGTVNPTESAIIESAHPLEDSIDEYCPVHIPGAVKIRLTFDPLCDIDGSTGFVRFYKNAQCVEYWGDDKYTGKYSDPERNFPGAQSNRARSLQYSENGADADMLDLNVLEIPSDRFLVYFHNEGSSNSWGFRILASPEFEVHDGGLSCPTSYLNPYPFYFGEAPGRVLDEPAAKCWIYQPKVLSYPISESDLTDEIQASFPGSEDVLNCIPPERVLHTLGMIRTCAETSFGRGHICTPENVRNLMFLSFDNRVPVEIRIGSIRVLKDLVGLLDPDITNTQLKLALPHEEQRFMLFAFNRLARSLDIWRRFHEMTPNEGETRRSEEEESVLELRISAQGEASLAAAYISLLRSAAGCSCWGDKVFELVLGGLRSFQAWNEGENLLSENAVGQALASVAMLGGSYSGAYIGGRVSCCVNVDGKEMIETGFLVQIRMKNGTQVARVMFDCDRSSTVDVPLTDVAHLDDDEQADLANFLEEFAPFASELKDLYHHILAVDTDIPLTDCSYQPKITKKENVEVLESEHPYAPGEDVTYSLNFRGAHEIVVRFDKMSCTAGPNDYVQFKKREGYPEQGSDNGNKYWGEEKYYGDSFPGVGATAPLRIPAGCVDVHFNTEGTSNAISEWGFKLTAHAFEETLVYPPEVAPPIQTSALNDIRTRCIKSIGQVLQSQKPGNIIQGFTPLLPLLAKIANAPSDGRPIQSSPKSQVFESKHPYANSVMEYMKVTFSGASTLTIVFDSQSRTEQGCDYLCFFKDKSLTDRWGAHQYCGVGSDANWPGIDDRPPLVIPADSFTLFWFTDGSNVDWGWKFNVTAEFLPEFPMDKSLKQLDSRSYRLFETLYEKMSYQRPPLKSEFEEFMENNDLDIDHPTRNPIRNLLCRVNKIPKHADRNTKQFQFRVTDEDGVSVYREKNLESDILSEFATGIEFTGEYDLGGWLKVIVAVDDDQRDGWVWQRTGDKMHATSLRSYVHGEDLLTLGVDDSNFESIHSALEMDESNDDEKSLTELCSPFAFDEFKGQMDRIQSLAYDTHRALATKAARDAILTFLSCDSNQISFSLRSLGDVEDILLLLSHFFMDGASDTAYDSQHGVLLALRKRLKHMILTGTDDDVLSAILRRCMEILQSGPGLLPKGRGAVRILESTHPYQDNADQYWDISIPGASRIKVVFDGRSKSEAGCDWVRFYKTGSNRTETFGPDQIGGRAESENWPGSGGRPPLYIDADSFEVYFHSDASNADWGFKLYAVGIFKEEERMPQPRPEDATPIEIVRLLSMACWVVEVVSSIPDRIAQASSTTFKLLYSTEMLHTLMIILADSPQSVKSCALQVLSNMSQSAAFHTIPAVYIEPVRDMINTKARAKYQAEERAELKSPYLQNLVQCAVAMDLALDSHCFDQCESIKAIGSHSCLPFIPGKDGLSVFISDSSTISGLHQFRLLFKKLAAPVKFGLVSGAESIISPLMLSVQWDDSGKVWVRGGLDRSDDHGLVQVIGYESCIQEGDIVIIQLDAMRHTLVVRKNGVLVAIIAGPAGSSALLPWEKLHLGVDIRLVVSHSNPGNLIEFSAPSFSSLALIPPAVLPHWYTKVIDAVGMMMDFRDNRSSTIISKESRHPLTGSTVGHKVTRENIDCVGAVALEIKFDVRTKLRKTDELRFFSEGSVSPSDYVGFIGLSGEIDGKATPELFVLDSIGQPNHSLSVGDKVVRSLDWEYSDEDGGAGSLGIVKEITAWGPHGGKGLRVRWQVNGMENVYRYGFNGRYDVQRFNEKAYQNTPFIIIGNSFSFEYLPSAATSAINLDLTSSSADFIGSLRLSGSVRLKLDLSEEASYLFESDCSIEWWACIDDDIFARAEGHLESAPRVELLRIGDGIGGSHTIVLVDQTGKCSLEFRRVDVAGRFAECLPLRELTNAGNSNFGLLVLGQWMHLSVVFSGSSVLLFKNGELIYSARCTETTRVKGAKPSLVFGGLPNGVGVGEDTYGACSPFYGHIFDVRLWDVAFRSEQLRSHSKGLDSVDIISTGCSRPGTPTSFGGKPLSPSMTLISSPRSPRLSSRSIAVPVHLRKWITTNRTNSDVVTVRSNCGVKTPSSVINESKPGVTVYYEAHALSGGKWCVGWILNGVKILGRSTLIGEEHNAYGIEPGRKMAHFSCLSQNLERFTEVAPTGSSSPRHHLGRSSFTNDIFCRNGDVLGCAINLATNRLTFYVNGSEVAECALSSADNVSNNPGAVGLLFPSASLGRHGAQGLAWNFGQRPFKFEPDLDNSEIMSVLEASGCAEEDAYFEVYDHDEQEWNRVVYRHKLQEITPHLVGWWKLNEGAGDTIDDASGNGQHGLLTSHSQGATERKPIPDSQGFIEEDSNTWWDENCSPPAAARRRTGDGAASPFFPFGSDSDASKKAEVFWGYKFFVIPHFSMETVGRRRFQSHSIRFDDAPRNLSLRHDQQLIKYINKKGQSKGLNVTQLLHGSWSDIAPQDNELIRWPALVEIISSMGDETTQRRLESTAKSDARRASDPDHASNTHIPGAASKSLVDVHNHLAKRFKLLQEFNGTIYRVLPLIAFHASRMEVGIEEKQYLLSHLVMEQRHRMLSIVKRTLWDNALGRTNESGVPFELTLNRPKAMRFRATGKTDAEGRHTLFSQAFRQLQSLDGSHFRREDALYHVTFLGENAQDAGGPYRETFAQYCEELQSTQLPLMLPSPNSQHNVGVGREKWLLNPGSTSSTAIQMLEFLGKLMGASVRSKQYLALNLAPLVWKKLAGEHVGLDDLAAVDSMLVNSMSKMRTIDSYGVTEEMFEDIVMETFTTLGADNRVIELKPGGASLAVTFNSRYEYADLVEKARLHESDVQVQAIFRGLAKVVPAKLLACFSGAELELMVCGSPEVNVDLLEKCTEYSSCSPTDNHIVWFWRTLRSFSHEERSTFLRFVWGRSRLPASADEFPQRFKLQSFNQQRAGRSVDAYMPVAHTCFFSVEIPAYTSEEILREKLLYAIYNCQEIDGDGDSVAANQLGWEE